MTLHRKDPERSTAYCKENLVPETEFETLTETEPKSLSFSLPLSVPHSHPPPPSPTNQYFPLSWLHLLSLCVVEKLATVAGALHCQLSWVWAHPVKHISRHVSEGVPGGGEQRKEDGQLNE